MRGTLATLIWLAGIVLAKGFWLTALAFACPLYGAVLIVFKVLAALGWI